ncbi:MAG: hypothetical protein RR280_08615 [Bacteroidaceae bacterium]
MGDFFTVNQQSWSGNATTSDAHRVSLQDLMQAGKAIATNTKPLSGLCQRVYRPVIGFYGNVYITDDFGNSIRVDSKNAKKVLYFVFGEAC